MNIVSTIKTTDTSKYVAFAAGCFWGVEHIFRKHFQISSQIVDIKVGYANGNSSITNPSYRQVCSGETNYAEAVLISYEPSNVSFQELTEFFFRIHDPTTLNQQGNDIGTQYRSGIFTSDSEQNKIAHSVKDKMQKEWYPNERISTVIEDLKNFYDAEAYHQLYLDKNVNGYQCPTHFLRQKPQ
jgi:peptide-methionine (S)-S-oxide reductase